MNISREHELSINQSHVNLQHVEIKGSARIARHGHTITATLTVLKVTGTPAKPVQVPVR